MAENSNRIFELLENVLGEGKLGNKGEASFFCPFCHHYKRKLAVNVNTGQWHCWVCNTASTNIIALLEKVNCNKSIIDQVRKLIRAPVTKRKDDAQSKNVTLALPNEFIPLVNPRPSIEYKNAINYLLRRGVTIDQIYRYNIGYCEDGAYRNRIIVPSYDEEGNLNYFVGRYYYNVKGVSKYKNPPVSKNIFPFELYVSWMFPIFLVEGVFDAIAIDYNAVPLLGKSINDKIIEKLLLHNVNSVYLCLDADAVQDIYKIAERLVQFGINAYTTILPKDTDPAILGQQKFLEYVNSNSIFIDKITLTKLKMIGR